MERKAIFASDNDKKKFLSYLNIAHMSYGAIFHSYALMDNHYHLILETPAASLSKIMHYINASYAAYFNAKHKRVGPLYQGRYKAILVQQDEYLHYLSCYIHLNPVRAGIVRSPEKYTYSSYVSFVSKTNPPDWLTIDLVLSMFDKKRPSAKDLYRRFVIENSGREKEMISRNTKNGIVLGSDNFFTHIKEKFIDMKEGSEIPILRVIKAKAELSMESIRSIAEENITNDKRFMRSAAIYLSRKYTQKTLNEIASFFGAIQYTGVSQVWQRMEIRRGKDKNIERLLARMEAVIAKSVM